jgi:hypothetical protein
MKMLDESTHKLENGEVSNRSQGESESDSKLYELTRELLPHYGPNWGVHSLVTLKRMALSRVIYYYELYQKIVQVPGVICEFGVQWGATLALLQNLRGMYEPYNVSRTIVGFDTFEGFASVDAQDGHLPKVGDYRTMPGYERILEEILRIHEACSPVAHIKKFQLVKGDAMVTVNKWLADNPHAVIAMAIFDMDVYQPTRTVLEQVIPRLTKGSLLVFDELSCREFPGETVAVQETLGLNNFSFKRFPHQSYAAWAVFGE